MRTLVICAHQDDESFSCGGLIRTRVQQGHEVFVMTLFGRNYGPGLDEVCSWAAESEDFQAARNILGYAKYLNVCSVEGEPQQVGYYSLLHRLEKTLRSFEPTEVVIPSAEDLNQDHRHLADVCRIALRPANLLGVERVLEARSFDARVQECSYYVPLSRRVLDTKLAAMACYRRESRKRPHVRSPVNAEALHRVFGAKSGQEFAEGYGVHLILDN